ncbi:hypothetical protein [Campylobacter troglodytis]|uniref:hypothetical protein n=1 Tax=Campylobacter troglodytis TaxID=654363 RepID=UPI001FEA8B28|nr:hypothetical protein [Campylobacter troglodytis]
MSANIEVNESYFLQRFVPNCVIEGTKRMQGKCVRGAGNKTSMFLLRVRTRAFARRYVKTLG